MKKFMTAVTAVSLSAMMLAGCGKTDVQETTVQESTTAETEQQQKPKAKPRYTRTKLIWMASTLATL